MKSVLARVLGFESQSVTKPSKSKQVRKDSSKELTRPKPCLETLEQRELLSGFTRSFDADHRPDMVVWRPSDGTWYVRTSLSGFNSSFGVQYGLAGDVPIQNSDFDGDGRADMAVWRPSNGTWYVRQSSSEFDARFGIQWGQAGDIPIQNSDFDGDDRADMVVWRPSDGTWYVRMSSTEFNGTNAVQWGQAGDIPIQSSDFDGDRRADMAVWRPSNGTWYVRTSSSGFTQAIVRQWGVAGDIVIQNSDFDGDRKADMAVWRPSNGTWYVRMSSTGFNGTNAIRWGQSGDVVIPNSDFDGDGRTDMAVWRPSNGTWYVRTSSSGFSTSISRVWGIAGDIPIQHFDIDDDSRADMVVFRPSNGTWYVLTSRSNFASNLNYQWGVQGDIPMPSNGAGFQIQLDMNGLTPSQQVIFHRAANRWEQVIIGDLPNAFFKGLTVDDVLISANSVAIDGPGTILARANADAFRSGSSLPYHGWMQFDTADVANFEANGRLFDVVLHEMGHVLGVGSIWSKRGLLQGAGTANPRFLGKQATAAYNAIFGRSETSVPVEGNGSPVGSRDSHWRESTFANELMTPRIDGTNLLSRVTAASMIDLGYVVNMNAADAYTSPATASAFVSGSVSSGSMFAQATSETRSIDRPAVLVPTLNAGTPSDNGRAKPARRMEIAKKSAALVCTNPVATLNSREVDEVIEHVTRDGANMSRLSLELGTELFSEFAVA